MNPEGIEKVHQLFKKAWQNADQGAYDEALMLIDQVLEKAPTMSIYWVAKAQFLYDTQRYADAEAAAGRAVELKPGNYFAWTLLGFVMKQAGHCDRALDCFAKSLELKPDHNVYTVLAGMELSQQPRNALLHAEKALELEPSWDEAKRIRDKAEGLIAEAKKRRES